VKNLILALAILGSAASAFASPSVSDLQKNLGKFEGNTELLGGLRTCQIEVGKYSSDGFVVSVLSQKNGKMGYEGFAIFDKSAVALNSTLKATNIEVTFKIPTVISVALDANGNIVAGRSTTTMIVPFTTNCINLKKIQ
jgi:hypothetical protein